jgi:hypothetical protein
MKVMKDIPSNIEGKMVIEKGCKIQKDDIKNHIAL